MKTIQQATEIELKAEAWDTQVLMAQLQNKLNIIMKELTDRRNAPKPIEPTKQQPVDSVDVPREDID